MLNPETATISILYPNHNYFNGVGFDTVWASRQIAVPIVAPDFSQR
jgi:hypothetical protein